MHGFGIFVWGLILFGFIVLIGLSLAGVDINAPIGKDNSQRVNKNIDKKVLNEDVVNDHSTSIVELFKNGESIVLNNIMIAKSNGWVLDKTEKYFIKNNIVVNVIQ